MIRFFLERPILSIAVSLFIVIMGLACLKSLPIEQYPSITPPVIMVTARLPGASAQTLADSVAAPLEKAMNGVEEMIYMFSQNVTPGETQLNVYFEVGSDPELALINTQNKVNLALPLLPEEVRNQGITVKRSSPTILLFVALVSPKRSYDSFFLTNYASIYIIDELQRIRGVNSALVLNARDYSMRIWLKPDRLGQFGLTTNDVTDAIRTQNALHSIGEIGQEPTTSLNELTIPVTALGRLTTPAQFENVILRANPDGSTVTLKDVGRVELGARDYSVFGTLDSQEGAFIGIYQDSSSNAIDVAGRVKEKMNELAKNFPLDVAWEIPYDTTKYIKLSVTEAIKTLLESAILVSFIIFIFLHSARAAFIPVIAMIISMIGTFIGIYMMGNSINTLSLFGMVLAMGIVVDDAVVVVENIEHNIRTLSLSAKEATLKTMEAMTAPVIAIVFALCSVFIPVAFIGGIPGQFYKQFALTIVTSVILSGFVALTLTPALAAIFFQKKKDPSLFARTFNAYFLKLTEIYLRGVDWLMKKSTLALSFLVILFLAIGFLFYITPLGFVPSEDQGLVLITAELPDGASLSRVKKVSSEVEKVVKQSPAVQQILSISGYSLIESISRSNMAAYFVSLKDWGLRKKKKLQNKEVLDDLNKEFSTIPEAKILAINPPIIPGVSVVGGFDFWIVNRGDATMGNLEEVVNQIVEKAKKSPSFSFFITSIKADCMELSLEVDQLKALAYNVKLEDIFSSLQTLLGSVYINDFNKYGKVFQVVAQAEPSARNTIFDIGDIYVRSQSNQMIPLKSLIMPRFSKGPTLVSRFNGSPAALISVIPAISSPDKIIEEMEEIANEFLMPGMSFSWGGLAYQQKETGGVSSLSFLGGLLILFLTLAALYERWSLPCIVLLAVPFGVFGALLAISIRQLSIDIYFQVGLIALIGLSAKNAILIVEFARLQRKEGKGIVDSAREAARLRFRAILMTSLTLIFGVLPLVFSTGAGAASRHSVGTGVIGGMIFATFLALFFIPFFFRLIEEWVERRKE